MAGINISEWIAIGGIMVAMVGAWIKLQKDITRMDVDLQNLKDDFHDERSVTREALNEIKSSINTIKDFLMNKK